MKMKSLILIFIALGCGLVATIGISQVMEKNSGGGTALKMDQILVAKTNIDIGATLDANSVQLEEWPAAKVPEGAVHSLEEVTGKFPQARFYKGEPILLAKISDKNQTAADRIPDGYRTSTIKVDEDTVMEGIGPGDRVDVMVFLRKGEGIHQTGVYPIIKNVRVFSKGAQTERTVDAKGETRSRTISLIVKPSQAQEIALASEMGRIRLALRNPKDDPANDKDQVVPLQELLNGKSTDGDEKKPFTASGTNEFIPAVKNAIGQKDPVNPLNFPAPAPKADPAKGPVFRMVIHTPNDVKAYDWSDLKELPVESTLLSVGASGGLAPSSPAALPADPPHSTPPITVEHDSKGTTEKSTDNP